MKEKVNDLVRLHEAMQEKLKTASYSEQIQNFLFVILHSYILTYLINGLECTFQNILMSLNILFELYMKLGVKLGKSRWHISKTSSLKRKNYHH